MFEILETLFKLLYKTEEDLKTDILLGIYYLSHSKLKFQEVVFAKIIMQADTFLKILENDNYNQSLYVIKTFEKMSELYNQPEFMNALLDKNLLEILCKPLRLSGLTQIHCSILCIV
jgi:hypothetical protein